MNAFRCLRVAVRPTPSAYTAPFRPSIARIALPQRSSSIPSSTRSLSLLSLRRPVLPSTSSPATLPVPGSATSGALPASDALDLAAKMSAHPAMGAMQIRCGPRDTYNPSHFVRKRRHGFLSRLKTKKGRKILMRRLKKGRWNLSH